MREAGRLSSGSPFPVLHLLLVGGLLLATCLATADWLFAWAAFSSPALWGFALAAAILDAYAYPVPGGRGWVASFLAFPIIAAAFVLPIDHALPLVLVTGVLCSISKGGTASNRIRYATEVPMEMLAHAAPVWALAHFGLLGTSTGLATAMLLIPATGFLDSLVARGIHRTWRICPGMDTDTTRPGGILAELTVLAAMAPIGVGLGIAVRESWLMLPFTTVALLAVSSAFRRAAAAADTQRQLDMAQRQLSTDPLTGLINREVFFDRALARMVDARRNGQMVTLFMADLDNFKHLNDSLGHMAGDRVLAATGEVLSRLNASDALVGRYGGEEFVGLFVDGEAYVATDTLNRVRGRLSRTLDEHGVTISIGVASFGPDDALDAHAGLPRRRRAHGEQEPTAQLTQTLLEVTSMLELLVARADEALYEAKRSGKNRVMAWTPSDLEADSAAAA